MKKKYSTTLVLEIEWIDADAPERAEAVINEFVDKIAPIMENQITWPNAEWTIREAEIEDE